MYIMLAKVKKDRVTPLINWEPQVRLFTQVSDIQEKWDSLCPDNAFLQSPYLSVVERFPPKGMTAYYALIYKSEELVGKVYFQHKRFKAQESLTFEKGTKCPSFFSTLGFYLKEYVAKKVEFKALGVGNLMLSGQHAFYFVDGISQSDQHYLVDYTIDVLTKELSEKNEEPSVILMKDFAPDELFTKKAGVGTPFYDFLVQPNMILKMRDHWKSFKDYLGDMTSKYRVRYKRAKKKLGNIERREMTYDEIEANKLQMFKLYQEIANSAGFNLFILSPDYIPEMKRVMGEKVKINGYFLEGRLIGYTTLVKNHHESEAHFLGFENELNFSHQLYLNMLYDMVEESINMGVKYLNYSRTASEIKSSVGAEPVDLTCYIRHQNGLRNRFLPHLFDYLKPDEEWVQRHPFKTA